VRDDLGDEPPRERVGGTDPAAAHDHVLRAAQPDEAREPLRAARAGDHPQADLREAELRVVGGDAEVAGERQLEPDAEAVALDARDHRLREPLGGGDVPGEPGELFRRGLEKSSDVAACAEVPACAGDHDEADAVVAGQLGEEVRELPTRGERHAVHLRRVVERDRDEAACAVAVDAEAAVVDHARSGLFRCTVPRTWPEAAKRRAETDVWPHEKVAASDVEAVPPGLVPGTVPGNWPFTPCLLGAASCAGSSQTGSSGARTRSDTRAGA